MFRKELGNLETTVHIFLIDAAPIGMNDFWRLDEFLGAGLVNNAP